MNTKITTTRSKNNLTIAVTAALLSIMCVLGSQCAAAAEADCHFDGTYQQVHTNGDADIVKISNIHISVGKRNANNPDILFYRYYLLTNVEKSFCGMLAYELDGARVMVRSTMRGHLI